MRSEEAFLVPIIALEGIDGAGKTTLRQALSADTDLEGVHFTGEFESAVGKLLLGTDDWVGDPLLKLYAFAADRAFTFRALAQLPAPKALVWDRYTLSAEVYREAELILGRSRYGAADAAQLNAHFPRAVRTLYLDVDPETAMKRKGGDIERARVVRRLYEQFANSHPQTVVKIDASRPPREVLDRAKELILETVRHAQL